MSDLLKVISFLLRFSRELYPAFFLVLLGSVISGLSNTGLIALIGRLLKSVQNPEPILGWVFVGLCVTLIASRFGSSLLTIHIMQKTTFGLRMHLCKRILSSPLRRLENIGAHRLLASLTDDVREIEGAVSALPQLCIYLTVIVGCLVYLGWLSWIALLVMLGFMIIGTLSYQIPLLKALSFFRSARETWDELFRYYQGLVDGIKELKLHQARRRAFMTEILEPTVLLRQRRMFFANTIQSAANTWGQSLFFILIGVLLLILPRFLTIPIETITSYVLIVLYIMVPLEVILTRIPMLGRARIAAENLEKLGLTLSDDGREIETAELLSSVVDWGSLEMVDVSYTYYSQATEETFTLGPIDLTLRPGELIFIVGGNGSGKTTLAKILTGLYTPQAGEIRLTGEEITDDTRDLYRQQFSAVFSDFFLFERFLGLQDPHLDARARDYLVELELDRKLKIENGVISTLDLSQGQRKRLALMTALLENRPIYLFDEWAADQDIHFREVFYRQLLPQLKLTGKTIIVISHDDRYYNVGDRIVKLELGKVKYDGPAEANLSGVPDLRSK